MTRRKSPPTDNTVKFPLPPTAFARGYRRGLAAGIDLLEALEPGNECSKCERIPCDCAAIKAATVVAAQQAAA